MRKVFLLLSLFATLSFISCGDSATASSGSSSGTKKSGIIKNVDAQSFKNLYDSKGYILVDVRTPKEFAQGHIPGAKNIPLSRSFDKDISSIDRNKKVLVYCLTGARANRAMRIMKGMGFVETINLKGGIRDWVRAKFPFEK